MNTEIKAYCKQHGFPGIPEALQGRPTPNVPHALSVSNAALTLHPLRSLQNPSLVTSVYTLSIDGIRHEITKFLVLGKRAGGTPLRLSLFGGLDPGQPESVDAAVRLLTLLTLSPALAEDYAVFGYPCVNPSVFATGSLPVLSGKPLAERWKSSPESSDCLFFRAEFQRVAPNGIISLRSTGTSEGLRARVNSALIASEVVKPALLRLRNLVAVDDDPVAVFSEDAAFRRRRHVEGGLIPSPETQPWPFEIEIFAPGHASEEVRAQILVLAALDILRSYRVFSCIGGDL
jgi:hypothetical protein